MLPAQVLGAASLAATAALPAAGPDGCSPPVATCLAATTTTCLDGDGNPASRHAADRSSPQKLDRAPALRPTPATGDETDAILSEWAAASRTLPVPTQAARVRLSYEHPELTGHQADFVAACDGPVRVDAMRARGRWTRADADGSGRTLLFHPHDELAAAQTGTAVVSFDAGSSLPSRVTFKGRPTAVATVALDVTRVAGGSSPRQGRGAFLRVAAAETTSAAATTADRTVTADATTASDGPLPFPPPPAD